MEKSITKIFSECQASATSHPKLIKKLKTIYLKSDFKAFFEYFIRLLKFSLITEEKHPTVERTLAFVARFSTSVKTSDEDEKKTEQDEPKGSEEDDVDIDPFLVAIFEFLLQNHEANSRAVRLRVCQLTNRILNSMGEQASIDDQLYSTIYDTMLQRLMDKVPAVRVQAIHGLSRLQDPPNKECPVIKAYLFHLSMDPNPEVRRAVLSNIAITFQTLPDIIDRIRDTRDLVRRQAYTTLAQKVHLRSFTIAQRVLIVSEGLKDRSDMVRQVVCKSLLQAWLRLVGGSLLKLLKCLDVEASTEGAELVLKNLFQDVPYSTLLQNFDVLDANKLVPFSKLNPESALYWKCLAKHLSKEKADEYLEDILPDLSAFCEYLRQFILQDTTDDEMNESPQDTAVKMMEKDFVCQQLISLATNFDLSDEVGRRNLSLLIHQLLQSQTVGETCIKGLCEVFALLYPPVARVDQMVEIISDLREPATTAPNQKDKEQILSPKETPKLSDEDRRKNKIKVAQLSVKINQVRDELEECVRTLDLERARDLKEALEQLEQERTKTMMQGTMVTPHTTPILPSSHLPREEEEQEEEDQQLDDPQTMSRCLLIVCEILASADITTFGPILRSLHDNLILPCLKSEDLAVRRFAVKALALTCLVSKELAQQHLLLFIQISQMDVEEIQVEALQGLFDFWLVYGVEEFNSVAEDVNELPGFDLITGRDVQEGSEEKDDVPTSQTPAMGNMIALLTKMLETDSSDARTLTVEGLCKLLLSSRICSSKLLSHLILLWYNPNTEDDHLLRHMLGVFFPFYGSLGGSHQESLCGALVPTLHTLFGAPVRSPLSEVDLEDVINFMVSITSPSIVSNKSSEKVNAHDSLVFTMCAEILGFPDRIYTRSLAKNLSNLTLSPSNFASLRQVLCLTQKITKKISDKRALNYVDKFQQSVETLLQFAPKLEETVEDQTVNETVEVNDDAESTLQNSSVQLHQSRRKRILYSSQNDMQLISDVDSSENERTPSKTKRMSSSVASSPNNEKVFLSDGNSSESVHETDDDLESENETIKNQTKECDKLPANAEVELSVDNNAAAVSPTRTNMSSSDLFESPASTTRRESIPETTEESSEGDEVTVEIESASSSGSPPAKSPKLKKFQSARGSKKSNFLTVENYNTRRGSTSSSSSFYSARSTTRSSDLSPRPQSGGPKEPARTSVAAVKRPITRRSLREDSSLSTDSPDIVKSTPATRGSVSGRLATASSRRKVVVASRTSSGSVKCTPATRLSRSAVSSTTRLRSRSSVSSGTSDNESTGSIIRTRGSSSSKSLVRTRGSSSSKSVRTRSSSSSSKRDTKTPIGTHSSTRRTRLDDKLSSTVTPSSDSTSSQESRIRRSARKK